ncbi:MAG: hypothetical protein AB7V16_11840 [Vulcanibacillus sp.]
MKECLVCDDKATKVCPNCKNEYCLIHFTWHLQSKKACRKEYEKKHGPLPLD